MEFDPRIVMFVVFGAGLTLAVTLERWLARYWLSLPILYVAVLYGRKPVVHSNCPEEPVVV